MARQAFGAMIGWMHLDGLVADGLGQEIILGDPLKRVSG